MLGVPSAVFQAGVRGEARAREERFCAWWDAPGTEQHLRKAALCVRLTLAAVKITAKKDGEGAEGTAGGGGGGGSGGEGREAAGGLGDPRGVAR